MKVALWYMCLTLVLTTRHTSAADDDAEREVYRTSFNRYLAQVHAESRTVRGKLLQRYKDDLDQLLAMTRRQGDLDKLLAVQTERRRINGAATIPAEPPHGLAELVRLWEKSVARLDTLTVREAQAVNNLATDYDRKLEDVQRTLTKQDKIEDAIAIRRIRAELTAHPDVVAARECLRRQTTAGDAGKKVALPAATAGNELKPIVLDATRARQVGQLPVHDDPPRVGIHALGSGLDWGTCRILPGRYACALTYSSPGRASDAKGTAEVTVGNTVLHADLHGTAGWGTPKRILLGDVQIGAKNVTVSLSLSGRKDGVTAVCDVWQLDFVPHAKTN